MENNPTWSKAHTWRFWVILAVVVFLVVSCVGGRDGVAANRKVITVQGTGEVSTVQDTMRISFTVTRTAGDVTSAQNEMNKSVTNIINAVKELGISEKDIKTTSYSVYPHYTQVPVPCSGLYCPLSYESRPDGFDATQTVEIRTKDLSKSGDLVTAIGRNNPTNVSGLEFIVENDEEVKRQARQMAIEDARKKAKELAKDLGVRIKGVVSFDESSGGGYPYFLKAEVADGRGGTGQVPPSLPTGEQKITSNVTVVYEIR